MVNSVVLEPFLLINTNENMLAFANGQPIPAHHQQHLCADLWHGGRDGQHNLIARLLSSSSQDRNQRKQVARLSLAPGLFNINEPVIFGLPIVFNLPLMIPFVLLPAIGIYFAWLTTTLGLMSRCVVMIPWTTPPILSAWLATAGTGGRWWCSGNHRIWCILLPFPQSCRASGVEKTAGQNTNLRKDDGGEVHHHSAGN